MILKKTVGMFDFVAMLQEIALTFFNELSFVVYRTEEFFPTFKV